MLPQHSDILWQVWQSTLQCHMYHTSLDREGHSERMMMFETQGHKEDLERVGGADQGSVYEQHLFLPLIKL